jgi:hypothetical protein
LLKNFAASAAHGNAVLAVGLRTEALLPRFLIATTASSVFQSPSPISDNQCSSVVKSPIRNIRVHSRLLNGPEVILADMGKQLCW